MPRPVQENEVVAPKEPLQFLKVKSIAGRLPFFGKWLEGLKPGVGRALAGAGLTLAELNLQQGGQDLVAAYVPALFAAIREDMPDKDLGAIFGEWLKERPVVLASTLIPGLVGGSIAGFKDLPDGGRSLLQPEVMRRAGFSEEQIAAVHASANPEAEFRRQFSLRTKENIREGIDLIYGDEARLGETYSQRETALGGKENIEKPVEFPNKIGSVQSTKSPFRNEDGTLRLSGKSSSDPRLAGAEQKLLALVNDAQAADARYDALPESRNGKVINTDIAREMMPEYAKSREGRMEYLPATDRVAKLYAADRLWREIHNRGNRKRLLFTAGDVAAGKSTILTDPVVAEADLVFDGTLRQTEAAIRTIEAALKQGWDIKIQYVQRPIDLVARGAIERAHSSGRWIELNNLEEIHRSTQESILKIGKKFENNPRVSFGYWHNDAEDFSKPATRISREDIENAATIAWRVPAVFSLGSKLRFLASVAHGAA